MSLIIVDGGSSPHGQGAGEYGGWAAQLHRDAQANGDLSSSHVVTNHALPRITLPFIIRNLAPLAEPLVRLYKGDAVRILTTGLNEAAVPNGMTNPPISPDKFRDYLGRYAAIGTELQIPTVYIGPQVIDNSKTHPSEAYRATIEDDIVAQYADIVREHAQDEGMPFVNVRTMFAPYIGSRTLERVQATDGIHYNKQMHQEVHRGVVAALSEIGVNF
jgi:lysophospholipase L1-like esterase